MIKKNSLFIFTLLFFFHSTLTHALDSAEVFTLEKNYVGMGDKSTPVKLELGLKYQIFHNQNVFFGYHQKTLWDINNGSSPVIDTNYNPQLYHSFGEHFGYFWNLGIIEHLSNGQTGARSRGVNSSYLQATKNHSFSTMELDYGLKAFISYHKDNGSKDIVDYEGIWKGFIRVKNFLSSYYSLFHAAELRISPGGVWGTDFSNGNWELNMYAVPHPSAKFTILGQIFTGRNEYLLDNKDYHLSYRLGVSIYL